MPAAVDPRQRELIAAAWTVGTLANLLGRERVASLTFFETVGWKGVLAGPEPLPADFGAQPGEIYPVYHVFPRISRCNQVARRGPKRRLCLALFLCRKTARLAPSWPICDQKSVNCNSRRPSALRSLEVSCWTARVARRPASGCFRRVYLGCHLTRWRFRDFHNGIFCCPAHVTTHVDFCFLSRP